MEAIFLKAFNLSVTAGWIVLAVIALRFLLKKAPKWINCLLWGIVALRLCLPFSIESIFSLIPSAEVIPQNISTAETPAINSGVGVINDAVNPIISNSLAPNLQNSVNPIQILLVIASVIWVIGIFFMLIYATVSYVRLRVRVSPSILYKDNVYYCDNIDTPFILGIIKAKIYLPSGINEDDIDYVIAHEKAHLKRCDHIIKPIGFLLLSVYWFNPLIWVAYILLCRDIEAACDQKVIRDMDNTNKKGYLEALVSCSVHRRMIMACPLAFGEVGVKGRIKAVINYKKPAFWVVVVAVITCLAVAVGFLTNPKTNSEATKVSGSDLDGISVKIEKLDSDFIEVKWINNTEEKIIFGEEFYILRKTATGWKDCRKHTEYAWNLIAHVIEPLSQTVNKYNVWDIKVSKDGIYRFKSDCFIDGKPQEKYEVWVDFEIKNGVYNGGLFVNDGEVFFYSTATYENDTPIITKHAEFGSGYKSFLKTLEKEKWTDDNLTDRISFDFNGKIFCSGDWLYFSYEQKVVYYDHYFCDVEDSVIEIIKNVEERAENFSEIIEYTFEDSPDPIKPNLRLSKVTNDFQFTYSSFSSYAAIGEYEYYNNTLICRTDDGKSKYTFNVKNNSLVFDASGSSKIPEYKYSADSSKTECPVPDGARFTLASADNENQNPYFNATVVEVYDNTVLVKPFSDEDINKTSDKIYVSTDVISTNPVPKLQKGMEICVVYNGKIQETYPASINGVFAIYELDQNDEVIYLSGDEVKYIFNLVEISYSNGMYSYVADVEGLPTYEIINDMELYEMHFNGPHNLHGKMTEIKLSDEKFDSRFSTYEWDKTESIRKNNKTAWEIYSPFKTGDMPLLYLLLEQTDGTFYLAVGYYDSGLNNPPNSDDSLIRWVYKLEQVDSVIEANPKW